MHLQELIEHNRPIRCAECGKPTVIRRHYAFDRAPFCSTCYFKLVSEKKENSEPIQNRSGLLMKIDKVKMSSDAKVIITGRKIYGYCHAGDVLADVTGEYTVLRSHLKTPLYEGHYQIIEVMLDTNKSEYFRTDGELISVDNPSIKNEVFVCPLCNNYALERDRDRDGVCRYCIKRIERIYGIGAEIPKRKKDEEPEITNVNEPTPFEDYITELNGKSDTGADLGGFAVASTDSAFASRKVEGDQKKPFSTEKQNDVTSPESYSVPNIKEEDFEHTEKAPDAPLLTTNEYTFDEYGQTSYENTTSEQIAKADSDAAHSYETIDESMESPSATEERTDYTEHESDGRSSVNAEQNNKETNVLSDEMHVNVREMSTRYATYLPYTLRSQIEMIGTLAMLIDVERVKRSPIVPWDFSGRSNVQVLREQFNRDLDKLIGVLDGQIRYELSENESVIEERARAASSEDLLKAYATLDFYLGESPEGAPSGITALMDMIAAELIARKDRGEYI